jgi:hypothetical protein
LTVRSRLRLALALARPVEPRLLPSRRALHADAAPRRNPLAACLLLVLAALAARRNPKPIPVATVVLAGYPAVVYRRFRACRASHRPGGSSGWS